MRGSGIYTAAWTARENYPIHLAFVTKAITEPTKKTVMLRWKSLAENAKVIRMKVSSETIGCTVSESTH